MSQKSSIIKKILVIATVLIIGSIFYIGRELISPIPSPDDIKRQMTHEAEEKSKKEEEQYEIRQIQIRSLYENQKPSNAKCPIHGETLLPDKVPIQYGLILPTDEYMGALENIFPNSNQSIYGGCMVEKREFGYVLFCSSCREAENRWKRENNWLIGTPKKQKSSNNQHSRDAKQRHP